MKIKAIVIIGLLLLASAANAAVCPEIVPLGSIHGTYLNEPVGVAVRADGIVYVTDMVTDRLYGLNRAGNIVVNRNFEEALAVALDSSGRVYVSSMGVKDNAPAGEVDVYDQDFNPVGSLGSGMGEFVRPTGILVDGETVYVADSGGNAVKYYDRTSLAYLGSFEGFLVPGAISALSTGNYIVTDRTWQYDTDGTRGLGAGAYIVDGSGAKVSGNLLTYGFANQPGMLAAPGGLLVDAAGRVMISGQNNDSEVEIFDESGNYICDYKISPALVNPRGMGMGGNNILYVAASDAVFMYGVDDYTDMSVTPKKLDFEAQECGPAPSGQNVSISNNGPGVLHWELAADQPWIVPASTSGDINGIAEINVDVSVDASGLAPGEYAGTITVTGPGAKAEVAVNLTVLSAPVLGVSAAPLHFIVSGTALPPAQTFGVELSGDASGSLRWTALANVPWIGLTPSSGPSNASAMVSADIDGAGLAGLPGGDYAGSITVDAGCAEGSPAAVPVSLTYIKGGTITVSTNSADATFTISGPSEYSGSGTSFQADAAPEGDYTISFGSIDGFKTPDSYSLPVTNGGITEFSGNYTDLRELNNIITSLGSLAEGLSMADEVKVFDGAAQPAGQQLGSFVVSGESLGKGTVTASGDVDGDGLDDIVVSHELGVISGFSGSGAPLAGFSFRAFPYNSTVDVAVADLDGDGAVEIIAGSGKGSKIPAAVRVFRYTGAGIEDTGINFLAFQEWDGVVLATGDVDGDGVAEILTTPGTAKKSNVQVRVWKVRDVDGVLEAYDAGGFADGLSYQGADIAAGDLDADGTDEVVLSLVSSTKETTIAAYRFTGGGGEKAVEFPVASPNGANIAAGDTDFDGRAEIVACDDGVDGIPVLRIYSADGTLRGSFEPYDQRKINGVNISLGQVGK